MTNLDQNQKEPRQTRKSEIVKLGSLGIYAEDASQAWGLILTFLTLFIWFVYLNNELGDTVFRSIITVGITTVGTIAIYRFWTIFHKRIWKRFRG